MSRRTGNPRPSPSRHEGMTYTYTVNVLAPDGSTFAQHTYTVTYITAATHKAQLTGILVDGTAVKGFDPARHQYNASVNDPDEWMVSPQYDKASGMTVSTEKKGADATITVTSGDGLVKTTYKVHVTRKPFGGNGNNALACLHRRRRRNRSVPVDGVDGYGSGSRNRSRRRQRDAASNSNGLRPDAVASLSLFFLTRREMSGKKTRKGKNMMKKKRIVAVALGLALSVSPMNRVAHPLSRNRYRGTRSSLISARSTAPIRSTSSAPKRRRPSSKTHIRLGHRRVRPIHHRLLRRQGIIARHGRGQDPHRELRPDLPKAPLEIDTANTGWLVDGKIREGQAVPPATWHTGSRSRARAAAPSHYTLHTASQDASSKADPGRAEGRDRHRQWHRRQGLQSGEGRHIHRARRRGR